MIAHELIGTLFAAPNAFPTVANIITDEMFAETSGELEGKVFSVIAQKLRKGQKITPGTVAEEVNASMFHTVTASTLRGWIKLTRRDAVEEMATSIRDSFVAKRILSIFDEGVMRIKNGENPIEVMEWGRKEETELLNNSQASKITCVADITQSVLDKILFARQSGNNFIGIDSGYVSINEKLAGWCKGELTVVGGNQSMGKTTYVMNLLLNVAKQNIGVGIFSLEMEEEALLMMLVSIETGISLEKIRVGRLDDGELAQVTAAFALIHDLPIYIKDDIRSAERIADSCRFLKMSKGVQLFCGDYLQLMTAPGKDGYEKTTNACATIKFAAQSLKIPFILLSQLNRNNMHRGGAKRPTMADFRGSGQIEEMATNIALVHRPEYHKIFEDDQGRSLKGVMEVIWEKVKLGNTGTTYWKSKGNRQMTEWDIDADAELGADVFFTESNENKTYTNNDISPVRIEPADDSLPF